MISTAGEITRLLKGELIGNAELIVHSPASINDAKEGNISFIAHANYEQKINSTNAPVLIVNRNFNTETYPEITFIKVENVYASLGILLSLFDAEEELTGISSNSIIKEGAIIGENVTIGDFAVIESNVSIGNNTMIKSHAHIAKNSSIGSNSLIYEGVKIYKNSKIGTGVIIHANAVIGSDGFGFYPNEKGEYHKIPQIGNVIIENDVEIGAGTTIDRATLGSTIIRRGVKLDNLVQIAHNVEIGEHTVIAAQTGIAGSTKVGKNCRIGGQVGIVGHIEIPDKTEIQGQSGVTSAPQGKNIKLYGSPAIEYNNYLKSYVYFKNLPDLSREIRMLKNEINIIKSKK